jgi:hypothetical protein
MAGTNGSPRKLTAASLGTNALALGITLAVLAVIGVIPNHVAIVFLLFLGFLLREQEGMVQRTALGAFGQLVKAALLAILISHVVSWAS